uniref:Uncharacterized protein n=1 Tax=uncultured euryarchaeote Rifle_16ft_4_minimus_309 TaxID=1665192 RepID=A0A0H4T2U7_9EURY|nr:hypothetical protein [uncultured euryarchaeote Rifle_16ft_4_minimus_309]
MCDEYHDERMRAFWRALADQTENEELEDELDAPVIVPLRAESDGPEKRKARALLR